MHRWNEFYAAETRPPVDTSPPNSSEKSTEGKTNEG
jgi:hypothetical protein